MTYYIYEKRFVIGGLRGSFLGGDVREYSGVTGGVFGVGDNGGAVCVGVCGVVAGRAQASEGERMAGRGGICRDGIVGGGVVSVIGKLRHILY